MPRATAHDHAATRHAFDAYAKHVLQLDADGPRALDDQVVDGVWARARPPVSADGGRGDLPPAVAGAAAHAVRRDGGVRADDLRGDAVDVRAAGARLRRPAGAAAEADDVGPPRGVGRRDAAARRREAGARAVRRRAVARLRHHRRAVVRACRTRSTARRSLSMGRPLPGIDARVVDDAGQAVAPMEIGTLEVRGPNFAGALKTGDRFLVDDDGYYFYCGRADDLFKVSGRWVAPGEVERALLVASGGVGVRGRRRSRRRWAAAAARVHRRQHRPRRRRTSWRTS